VNDAQRLDVGVPAVAGLPALPDVSQIRADRGRLGVGELLVPDRDAGCLGDSRRGADRGRLVAGQFQGPAGEPRRIGERERGELGDVF